MMMPLVHNARDAVSVFENDPDHAAVSSHVMCVGSMEGVLPGAGGWGHVLGLVQFPGLVLPNGYCVTGIRLCLLVRTSSFCIQWIGIYRNLAAFDPETVTYRTRPEAGPRPLAVLQVPPGREARYAACDLTESLKDDFGELPGLGLSMIPLGQTFGMTAFSSQPDGYMPYLEITLAKKEGCGPHPGREDRWIENLFMERVFDVSGEAPQCTPAIPASSAGTITFFVKNEGTDALLFHLEISPDGITFVRDQQTFGLEPGEMKAATPYLFGKFMRVCLNTAGEPRPISARVFCQAQTNHYMVKGKPPGEMPLPGAAP